MAYKFLCMICFIFICFYTLQLFNFIIRSVRKGIKDIEDREGKNS